MAGGVDTEDTLHNHEKRGGVDPGRKGGGIMGAARIYPRVGLII